MTDRRRWIYHLVGLLSILGVCVVALGQRNRSGLGYGDTPRLPNSPYWVHDGDRPQPRIVAPGKSSSRSEPGTAPSDAVVLFDGNDLSAWEHRNGDDARWKVEDGAFVITPRTGSIQTKEAFGDCQLHLEFATPTPPSGNGQGRGNSGIMLFGRYEIQVLDSFENKTYPDGQAGAIYGQYPPLVNASRRPGEWQSFDIVFEAPEFNEAGSLVSPAYLTLLHNGVLVHHHTPLLGPVAFKAIPSYQPHGPKGQIVIQDHGNPVKFRNIWIRPLDDYDQATTNSTNL